MGVNKVLGVLFAGGLLVSGTATFAEGFDPRQSCSKILAKADPLDREMIAAWSFGYIGANTKNIRPVDSQNNATLLRNIEAACKKNPQVSLLDLVNKSKRPSADGPGSENQAGALLRKWVLPGANYHELTQAILPTEDDIRFVYADPLASALVRDYAGFMNDSTAFGPKPGQDTVLVVHTTTSELVKKSSVLREFPGGYKDVLQYFRADVPIVRFKFVKDGETTGYAFDGLVFVNGRWVLMPKPWRSLP